MCIKVVCAVFNVKHRSRSRSQTTTPHNSSLKVTVTVQTDCKLCMHTALSIHVFSVGGYDGQTFLNTAECYDPVSNLWTTLQPMACCRSKLLQYYSVSCSLGDGTHRDILCWMLILTLILMAGILNYGPSS